MWLDISGLGLILVVLIDGGIHDDWFKKLLGVLGIILSLGIIYFKPVVESLPDTLIIIYFVCRTL
jgi:hypothetical protein